MDQIHEELKKPEVLQVVHSDEDSDSGRDSIITSQSLESVTFRSHDIIPFVDESPSAAIEPQTNRQSDTDYETCDSGMSSERSSVENATIEEGGTNVMLNKDKTGGNRRRKVSEKNRTNTDGHADSPTPRSDSILGSSNSDQNSAKDRKESANKAHQRASSHERPITIGGGDAGDVEFSDAVAEMEPLQGHRSRTLSGRSRNSSESESLDGRNQSPRHAAKRGKKIIFEDNYFRCNFIHHAMYNFDGWFPLALVNRKMREVSIKGKGNLNMSTESRRHFDQSGKIISEHISEYSNTSFIYIELLARIHNLT